MSSLVDPAVVATLARLHHEARGDWYRGLRFIPAALWGALRGQGLMKDFKDARPYVEHVRDVKNGFVSTTLQGRGMEVSVLSARAR